MEKNRSIIDEYQDFLDTKGEGVPQSVSDSIFSRIWTDLNPPALSVFAKLGLIQAVVGIATLLYCPQFGVALTSSMGLMHYLMQYGESVCMFGCGAFFVGSSLFVSSLLLRPEEVRVIRKHRVVQIASIATLSIVALSFFGGQVELTLGLVWVLGALIGGATFLQLGWGARKLALRYGM